MAHQLSFFCRAGEESGQEAMSQLLDAVLETGHQLVAEVYSPLFQDGTAVYRLRTTGADASTPGADWLTLAVHVGIAAVADSVVAASPNGDHGIWGSDLLAVVTLSGDSPDWLLLERIRGATARLWGGIPWDETSGFEIADGAPQAERGQA